MTITAVEMSGGGASMERRKGFQWRSVVAEGNFVAPLVWHHGEDRETIARELTEIANCGIRSFVLEPRPHPDYLGPGWWADLATVVELARSLGLRFWIFDDGRFPSGHAGGRVPAERPELLKRFLVERHIDVTGPLERRAFNVGAWLDEGESLITVVTARRVDDHRVDESSLEDVTALVADGLVEWAVPNGRWRIHIVVSTDRGGEAETSDYLNPVDPRSARAYIELVHEPHLARFRAEFGQTILGFFQDEPRFGNAPSYAARLGARWMEFPYASPRGPTGNHEAALPYSDALLTRFLDSPRVAGPAALPLLWFDGDGDATALTRYAFMDAASWSFADYLGELGEWCHAHGVGLIGHLIEDNGAHARLGYGPGHYFRAIRSQSAPGIDVVGQIFPGEVDGRSASAFGHLDNEFFYWGLAKLASSAAHLDPASSGIALCEAFGAYGWQLGLPLMKWLTDHLCVRGINFFVPHAFSPRPFDPDCPPHFFNGGLNPQWPYFRIWVDYAQKLCAALSGGRHVSPAAVLYHAEAEWAGDAMGFERVIRALAEDQLDADVVPLGDLGRASVQAGRLHVGTETYPALVIPGSTAIVPEAATLLENLSREGLAVVVAGESPRVVGSSRRLAVPAVALPEVAQALRTIGVVAVSAGSREPHLRVYHYVKDEVHSFFCVNESPAGEVHTELRLPAAGSTTVIDLFEGTERHLPTLPEPGGSRMSLDLGPTESCLISVDPFARDREAGPPRGHRTLLDIPVPSWTVSLSSLPAGPFTEHARGNSLSELSNLEDLSRFSGAIRYDCDFTLTEIPRTIVLALGAVHEVADVTVNGSHAGVRICPPYEFALSPDVLSTGENSLTVTICTSLARAAGDNRFDRGRPRPPIGLLGPVRWFTVEPLELPQERTPCA
ncbi:hypothetical protein [Dactylosporangium sp. CA-233914]|uniref:hypothetical protein n=1 Tax=Dactylosporangium sp. CA-233914 TaxID=3239934 RepID=UPI003D92681D